MALAVFCGVWKLCKCCCPASTTTAPDLEKAVEEAIDANKDKESASDESDDEINTNEPDHLDLHDDPMAKDMAIPNDSILEETAKEAIDANKDEESASDWSDDEIETNEPNHLDRIWWPKRHGIWKRCQLSTEGDNNIDDESNDSYTSVNEEDAKESSDNDDKSE